MESLPVDTNGIPMMAHKGEFFIFKTSKISSPAANILKQQMLSIGGECAISKHVITGSPEKAPVILMGTQRQFLRLIEELKHQPFRLGSLKNELKKFFDTNNRKLILKIGNKILDFSKKTNIMGIINVTPDSFYDGGKFPDASEAIEAAIHMVENGADIIDVGGESTRPGADPLDEDAELSRIIPVIKGIHNQSDIQLSVDTYKSRVAEEALQNGASMINDISALSFDPDMANVVSKYNASVVLMHIKGSPKNMQDNPIYENLIDEILSFLSCAIQKALDNGIEKNRIIIDPGIGFGKNWSDNYVILRYLSEFKSPGVPILVGPSRKSFIGKLLDLPLSERLEGTIAAVTGAVMNGANMVRVHDVKEAYRAVKVADAILGKVQS